MTAMSSEKFVLRPEGAVEYNEGGKGLDVCFEANGKSKDCASLEVKLISRAPGVDLGKVLLGGGEYRMVPTDVDTVDDTRDVREDLPVVRLMNADASGMKCLQTSYDKLFGKIATKHQNFASILTPQLDDRALWEVALVNSHP